jgi:hypothetical protein
MTTDIGVFVDGDLVSGLFTDTAAADNYVFERASDLVLGDLDYEIHEVCRAHEKGIAGDCRVHRFLSQLVEFMDAT